MRAVDFILHLIRAALVPLLVALPVCVLAVPVWLMTVWHIGERYLGVQGRQSFTSAQAAVAYCSLLAFWLVVLATSFCWSCRRFFAVTRAA